MKLEELIALQDRLLYKGKQCFRADAKFDWRNDCKRIPEGYVYVSVFIQAIDVQPPFRPTTIENGCLWAIADLERCTTKSFINQIRDQIAVLQLHEIEETISLDGEQVYDPHGARGELSKQAA